MNRIALTLTLALALASCDHSASLEALAKTTPVITGLTVTDLTKVTTTTFKNGIVLSANHKYVVTATANAMTTQVAFRLDTNAATFTNVQPFRSKPGLVAKGSHKMTVTPFSRSKKGLAMNVSFSVVAATPSPTPRPTASQSPTPTATPLPTPSPSASATPTGTATPTPVPTPSPSATQSPTVTPTASPSVSPSPTTTATATATPPITATPSPAPTETHTPTPTASPSATASPTITPVAVTATINWNATSSDRYHLHYGTASKVYTQIIEIGPPPFTTPPLFFPGTQYYFALSVFNQAGESAIGPEYGPWTADLVPAKNRINLASPSK